MLGELNYAEKLIADVGKQTLALYAIDKSGLSNFIMDNDNLVTRNLKRGFLWEVASELESEVMFQNSNFRQMNWMKVIDETAWNGLISAGMETVDLSGRVNDVLGAVLPASDLRDSFTTAVLIIVGRKLGDKFENTVVRNVSSLFGNLM